MSLRDQITGFQDTVLQRVGKAARSGSTKDVVGGSRLLEEIDELLVNYDAVERRFKDLTLQMNDESIIHEGGTIDEVELSHKARGEQRRKDFLADAESRGIPMFKTKGVRYRSGSHNCIGIASASENVKYPNRWFLGLPPDKYDGFVLLCEDHGGRVHWFIANTALSQRILPRLSTDNNGQIKFHVRRDGTRFTLDVPRSKRQSLNEIRDRFDYL